MKKTILSTLFAIVIVALISGVRTFFTENVMNARVEQLAGVYTTMEGHTDIVQDLLSLINLSQEKLALTGGAELKFTKLVEFTQSRDYRFSYDAEQNKQQIRTMYADALDAIYQGRSTLTEMYGDEIATVTKEKFQHFYAELYSLTSYNELLDAFVDSTFDYDALSEDYETGTYTIEDKKILCTIAGESKAEYMEYKLDGDTLTLTYKDMVVETYTRVN